MNKIFGIGLSKTGTQSLAAALRILGYSTIHYPNTWVNIYDHQAACDIPVSCKFQLLDIVFPNSKFILTIRNLESWLESCKQHFSKDSLKEPWRRLDPSTWTAEQSQIVEIEYRLYGTYLFDAELFTQAYIKHENSVSSYFHNRQESLLKLDLTNNDKQSNWKALMEFLGQEYFPFPWENKTIGA